MVTNLVNIFFAPYEFLPLPASEHAKLRANKADFSGPTPCQRRRTTKRDKFIQFLVKDDSV